MNFFGIGNADNISEFLKKKIIDARTMVNVYPKDRDKYIGYLDAYEQTLSAVILFDKEKNGI